MTGQDRDAVIRHVLVEWGDPIISKGKAVSVAFLPGLAADVDGRTAGALLYRIEGDECEIVVLFSYIPSIGVGTALINAVVEKAREAGCGRVWLITTNDNTPAIRFYQRRGFDLAAAHINAFEVTRRMKRIPPVEGVLGIDGIPIRHELEFEIRLR